MRRMSFVACAFARAPVWALAQNSAADPRAPVPEVPYRSAFGPPIAPLSRAEFNPADSVKATADVRRNLRGHLDILKWEAESGDNKPGPKSPAEADGTVLWPAQALKRALMTRPELMARTTMRALERAQRMAEVGHWSRAQLMGVQLVRSAAATQLASTQQQAFAADERLIRLTGRWGQSARISLPHKLPDLSNQGMQLPDLEGAALQSNPALVLAQINANLLQTGVAPGEMTHWQRAVDDAIAPAASPRAMLSSPLRQWKATACACL